METPVVPIINVQRLYEAIEKKEDFILLDVRTPREFEKGKISGSINLPVDNIGERVGTIIPDKAKTVYVYCLSGNRSTIAVSQMVRLGYKKVFDVKNGLLAWRIANLPVFS